MTMPRVGYQGDVGSNAEFAARMFLEERFREDGLLSDELIALVSSGRVVQACLSGECDYGVVALYNNIGGIVIETREAIAGRPVSLVWRKKMPIHHCLFRRRGGTDSLAYVASHIQALSQTRGTRRHLCPELEEMEISDTAIGARWLAEGTLSDDIAVICRKETGLAFGLELVEEDIEDAPSQTLFVAIQRT